MINNPNEEMLLQIIKKLPSDLLDDVILVGGAVIGYLLTDEAAGEVRPTNDVDLIVRITARSEFHKFEKRLRKAGFSPSMREGDPICRWISDGIDVDVMPCGHDILGFSNRWYPSAVANARPVKIGSAVIKMITAPYFLATKIEAFADRGNNDFIGSPDMEDMITLLDGRKEIPEEVAAAEPSLRTYLSNKDRSCVAKRNHDLIQLLNQPEPRRGAGYRA